jgi:hypothetical protein
VDRRLGRIRGRRAVADQVRFDREWAALRSLRRRPRGAAHRRRADLRRARQRRPPRAPELFRDDASRRAAGLLHRQGPAVGQPALRLAGAAPAAATAGGRALPPHVRPLRPGADRPLPRLRGVLGVPRGAPSPAGGAGSRGRRAPCSTRPGRAGRAADHRRGPRRHHPAGRAPARRARLPRHGRAPVRLQPDDPHRPHDVPRTTIIRSSTRGRTTTTRCAVVREPAGARVLAVLREARCRRPRPVVGSDRHRAEVPGAPLHAPGPGRPRPRQRGPHEPSGHGDGQLALRARAGQLTKRHARGCGSCRRTRGGFGRGGTAVTRCAYVSPNDRGLAPAAPGPAPW